MGPVGCVEVRVPGAGGSTRGVVLIGGLRAVIGGGGVATPQASPCRPLHGEQRLLGSSRCSHVDMKLAK